MTSLTVMDWRLEHGVANLVNSSIFKNYLQGLFIKQNSKQDIDYNRERGKELWENREWGTFGHWEHKGRME